MSTTATKTRPKFLTSKVQEPRDIVHSDVQYRVEFNKKFDKLVKGGKPFSANSFLSLKVATWYPEAQVGGYFGAALRRHKGVIKVIGTEPSRRAGSNGSPVKVYQAV